MAKAQINYITVGGERLQAGFTASPVQGNAPLPVQFTDTSTGNVTSWLWDFGDGTISSEKNPVHTYSGPGSYSVTLNASNMDEHSVLTLSAYINVTGDNGSGSSEIGSSVSTGMGSLAGAGASPEPESNVEAKVQAQEYIPAGNHSMFNFTKNGTGIECVEFDAKKTLGRTTTTIELLKERSVLTSTDPVGKVYKYLNIWVGNNGIAVPGNIENATVSFIVRKADAKMNETEESTVVLQRYEQGEWKYLNTTKTGGDDQYIYYRADTPGFSSVAITSNEMPIKENVTQPINKNIVQPKTLNNEASTKTNQPGKSNAADNKDWSKYSGFIRFFILFIVVLFIGLAIREKRK